MTGTNDLQGATSAATCYTNLSGIVTSAQGTGFKIAVGTLPPIDVNFRAANFATQQPIYNSDVLTNTAGADQTIDQTTVLVNPRSLSQYNSDGIHPGSGGNYKQAALVYPAVKTLGGF